MRTRWFTYRYPAATRTVRSEARAYAARRHRLRQKLVHPGRQSERTFAQGSVILPEQSLVGCRGDCSETFVGPGKQHQAGGVAVKPVQQTGFDAFATLHLLDFRVSLYHPGKQRARFPALERGGVHTCGFAYDEEHWIFEEDRRGAHWFCYFTVDFWAGFPARSGKST